jgi:hypothetical protein
VSFLAVGDGAGLSALAVVVAAATLAAATPVSRARRSILDEVFLLMALDPLTPSDRWMVD